MNKLKNLLTKLIKLVGFCVSKPFYGHPAIDDFGEQFASRVARKFYQESLTFAFTNQLYEGEIKKAGDRVNILQFLHDISLEDYVAGTDMSLQALFDTESQLVVEKRKSYNFAIDKTEELFTYPNDVADTLIENSAKVLERTVDAYTLAQYINASVNNWVGLSFRLITSSGDTQASVATTATGGNIVVQSGGTTATGTNNVAGSENPRTGDVLMNGFVATDVGRPIRLTSGATWATAWYKIESFTDTVTVAVVNYDGSTAGPHIPTGDILEGLVGASGGWLRDRDSQNGDGKPTTEAGWGYELGAAQATSVAAANVFEAITLLGEALDEGEIPTESRYLILPPSGLTVLKQASELQPTGIEAIYRDTIVNGKVMRVGGFDILSAAGGRVSMRVEHPTSTTGAATMGADSVVTTGVARFCVPAVHKSFCTFAFKWSESRIVDAENQFAKKYQGLNLFGAAVPPVRRKGGAVLYTSFGNN